MCSRIAGADAMVGLVQNKKEGLLVLLVKQHETVIEAGNVNTGRFAIAYLVEHWIHRRDCCNKTRKPERVPCTHQCGGWFWELVWHCIRRGMSLFGEGWGHWPQMSETEQICAVPYLSEVKKHQHLSGPSRDSTWWPLRPTSEFALLLAE
jgi:hypothetical protein